jgi:hypothetical protein
MEEIYMSSSEITNHCIDCKFRKSAGIEGVYFCPINKVPLEMCIEWHETICPIRSIEVHDKETVQEFAEGLIKNGVYSCKCSTVKEVAENLVEQFENHIKKYAKEYGVEVCGEND